MHAARIQPRIRSRAPHLRSCWRTRIQEQHISVSDVKVESDLLCSSYVFQQQGSAQCPDFGYRQITVRDGKGEKDRRTVLPDSLAAPLRRQIDRAKLLHEEALQHGYGRVYRPYALERKYPNAATEWVWQWVFPAHKLSADPRSGVRRRHHVSEDTLQAEVKKASRSAGVAKRVSCHTFRHSTAYASDRGSLRHPHRAGAARA